MPAQRRASPGRIAALIAAAAALVGALAACSVVVPVKVAGAVVDRFEHGYGTARVIDDAEQQTVLVVPAHPTGALAVFVHGSGQGRYTILRDRRDYVVARELVQHGYLVLAPDAGGRAWGDPASVADYRRAIARTVSAYPVRDVFLMAESMGGLATMQLAAVEPRVRAATAWYPVCDLRTMAHNPRFAAAIASAWGEASRAAVSPVAVPRIPLMVWASAHDTVVPAATNAAHCVAADRAAGGEATYIHTTGDHGDPSNFQPLTVLHFFETHRSSPASGPAVEQ